MSNEQPRYFTRHDASRILKLSLRTVDSLLLSGRLASFKIGGSRRIPEAALLNIGDSAVRERLGV